MANIKRIKPLEEIIKATPSPRSYHELVRELRPYVDTLHDARHLSWHTLIPKKEFTNHVERKASLFPQADTLSCLYCSSELTISMFFPRFMEDTLKAYRTVYYKPSSAQTCKCGNLNTLTDPRGNLRVYLQDGKEESFNLTHGPVQLLGGKQNIPDSYDITTLIDATRPKADDPFSFEVRSKIKVNHINFRGVSSVIAQTLLPSDFITYARMFNLVILTKELTYFPTGHIIPSKKFKIFSRQATEFLQTTLGIKLHTCLTLNTWFANPVLTPETTEIKNKIVSYIYHTLLPEVILSDFNTFTNKLDKMLDYDPIPIPNSTAIAPPKETRSPLIAPHLIRLLEEFKELPLSIHAEITVTRLPLFNMREYPKQFNQQDFRHRIIKSNITSVTMCYKIHTKRLKILFRERVKLLIYTLQRLPSIEPEDVLRNASNMLPRTEPQLKTPINAPLTHAWRHPSLHTYGEEL